MLKADAVKYLERIEEDEPVFILRGRDRFAPSTVAVWSVLVSTHVGKNREKSLNKATGALKLSEQMREYQQVSGSKIPD